MNDTQKLAGYLAMPPAGKGPGVLVLHAWWGLNKVIKDVCDRLAALGYVTYAPDLYHGQLATTIEEAEQLSSQLNMDVQQAKANTQEAVNKLLQYVENPATGIGVVGFSLGAYYALQLSGDDPEHVRAVVLFYGAGDGDFDRARAVYMGHFAENDPYEPAESVNWLEGALKSAGRAAIFHRYGGVGHWFFEPDRVEAYNEAAAELAWGRTVDFLNENLMGERVIG